LQLDEEVFLEEGRDYLDNVSKRRVDNKAGASNNMNNKTRNNTIDYSTPPMRGNNIISPFYNMLNIFPSIQVVHLGVKKSTELKILEL
jgi:hypothetical protein